MRRSLPKSQTIWTLTCRLTPYVIKYLLLSKNSAFQEIFCSRTFFSFSCSRRQSSTFFFFFILRYFSASQPLPFSQHFSLYLHHSSSKLNQVLHFNFFVRNPISLTKSTKEVFGVSRGLQIKLFSSPSTSYSPVRNLALHNNCRCSSQQ